MKERDTFTCRGCQEQRLNLDKKGLCCLCKNFKGGYEVKVGGNSNVQGTEVKSQTGRIDDNIWMRGMKGA